MSVHVFNIYGITCNSCSGGIKSVLASTEGITLKNFSVDPGSTEPKKVTIEVGEDNQDTRDLIIKHVEELGFRCEPLSLFEKILSAHLFLGILGLISGIVLLILSFALPVMPLGAMIGLGAFSSTLTLLLGAKSFKDAWVQWMKAGILSMDTLFTISSLTVLTVSIISFWIPWLPMMFDASLLIYGFRHIGIAIEDSVKEKISTVKFTDRGPKAVEKISAQGIIKIATNDIKPKDKIRIQPGEIIPVDGICLDEHELYNTILGGNPLPQVYKSGDKILAGMRLSKQATPLNMEVLNDVKTSYLAKYDACIEESLKNKAPIELETEELLTYFIPTILGISFLSGVTVGFIVSAASGILCAISVLVSACPCTLGLIIPLAVKTGLIKACEYGIQLKNTLALQVAEKINFIAFDLHGTLTKGIPEVKEDPFIDTNYTTPEEFYRVCKSLEQSSKHPFGRAIHRFAKQHNSGQFVVEELAKHHRAGVSGKINGVEYSIGDSSFIKEHISLPSPPPLEPGDNLIFVSKNQQVIGYFVMTDKLREDAKPTIDALKAQNIHVKLITGANQKSAERYAKALGITDIEAECVATKIADNDKTKVSILEEIKQNQPEVVLAAVGDAANDAQFIAASDFGIAVTSKDSDPITRENAQAIIQDSNLLPIIHMLAISQQTNENINQNLSFSLIYNLANVLMAGGVLITIGITLNPGVGVALMTLQACLILLNVYLFKISPLPTIDAVDQCRVNNKQGPKPTFFPAENQKQSPNGIDDAEEFQLTDLLKRTF